MNRKWFALNAEHFASSKRALSIVGRQTFGWTLLGVGVAGLALPILPGWLFIGWGVITLAADVPFFRRLVDGVEEKLPPLKAVIRRLQRGHPREGQAAPSPERAP